MSNKLEALRAKLNEAAKKSENNNTSRSGGDKASFPFWNTPEGKISKLRFLPDGNEDNPFFWVERQVIKMPFDGVVGGEYPTQNEVMVTVPCIDMFGGSCPVVAATKPLWNGTEDEVNIARKYWKKRSYIFQGFVVDSPIEEEEKPENPIRRFVINKSIYEIIYNSLMQPDMEDMPIDYEGGRDFKIAATKNGKWANYGTSNWDFKTRSLSEYERSMIDTHGLFNLEEAKGAEPSADGVEAIKAMFEDSLAGNPFDMEAYGEYYRPYTINNSNTNDSIAKKASSLASVSIPPTPSVAQEANTTQKASADDIIAKLRQKSNS